MKSPPSRAHQTMLAFDRISNNAGGNPPGGRALKQFLDFLFESLGCRRRREASRYPAFSIDKEFRKIPFDRPGSHKFIQFDSEENFTPLNCFRPSLFRPQISR